MLRGDTVQRRCVVALVSSWRWEMNARFEFQTGSKQHPGWLFAVGPNQRSGGAHRREVQLAARAQIDGALTLAVHQLCELLEVGSVTNESRITLVAAGNLDWRDLHTIWSPEASSERLTIGSA